jgi:hypothetical protein
MLVCLNDQDEIESTWLDIEAVRVTVTIGSAAMPHFEKLFGRIAQRIFAVLRHVLLWL